jgi:hypothetical protein
LGSLESIGDGEDPRQTKYVSLKFIARLRSSSSIEFLNSCSMYKTVKEKKV